MLEQSPELKALATWLDQQGPPDAWLAAGCVVQTVWNRLTGRPLNYGILDYDIVYFDPDLSPEAEIRWRKRLEHDFPGMNLDVKNQARVHQWYPKKFGIEIPPFVSVQAAMQTWPTTATATAARRHQGQWEILTPFGRRDLLGLIVRPNRTLASKTIYVSKTSRWADLWPELVILPWEQGIGPFEINGPVDLDPVQA